MRKRGAAIVLLLASACKPSVHGQCTENSDCRAGAVCGPQHVCQDASAPTISIQVFSSPDISNGWFPRTSDVIEIRAFATDGQGSGVASASATLKLDECPISGPCTWTGVPMSSLGAGVFSFQVPRSVQTPGVESALSFVVSVTDNVGNIGTGTGVLRIDDKPPVMGAPFLVTAGSQGEDGQIWFAGGAGAADVEIGIPVSDSGSGVAALTLQLAASDVAMGTALDVPAVTPPPGDGTIHFRLPASAVQGREGPLHFSLLATDGLQHKTSRSGDQILVDAVPPTIALAKVDYVNVTPTPPDCGAPDAADFKCGRQGGTHLLLDDAATVTFDSYDCGAGIAAAQLAAAVGTGVGGPRAPVATTQSIVGAASCANGSPNAIHRTQFTLNVASLAPTLPPPDSTGTTVLYIDASGSDLAGHAVTASSSATSGDGLALLSWWRWRKQATGNITGSPALLREASPRRIAIATDANITTYNNLLVLGADGTQSAATTVSGGTPSALAVGASNLLYATTIPAGSLPCGGGAGQCPTGTLVVVALSPLRVATCIWATTALGTAPAILGGTPEQAVAAAQAHNGGNGVNNLFLFSDAGAGSSTCNSTPKAVSISGDFRGITANGSSLFLANSNGFSSLDAVNGSYNSSTPYSFSPAVNSAAPPAIATGTNSGSPIFGADDSKVRRASRSSTTSQWQTDSTFNATNAGATSTTNTLPYTPVFDGTNIWTTDVAGNVYAWLQTTGAPVLGAGVSFPSKVKTSPPTLITLGNGTNGALVVGIDGTLGVINPVTGTLVSYGNGGATTQDAPMVAPVLEARGAQSSVAYVAAPGKWLYAWQLPYLPVAASSSAWPRVSRDTCNSRNATDPCP